MFPRTRLKQRYHRNSAITSRRKQVIGIQLTPGWKGKIRHRKEKQQELHKNKINNITIVEKSIKMSKKIESHKNTLNDLRKQIAEEEKFFKDRLIKLYQVGNSVLRKQFSKDRLTFGVDFAKQDYRLFDNRYGKSKQPFAFLNMNERRLEECNLTIETGTLKITHPLYDDISVPLVFLALSDRDFAKILRKHIREFKNQREEEKKRESEREIKSAENEIERLERQIAQKRKIVQDIHNEQQNRAEAMEERMREKIQRKSAYVKNN